MRRPARGVALAAGAALAVFGARAGAESGRVALVQPPTSDATIDEALHRIRGELTAEGFDVVVATSEPPLDGTVLAVIDLTVDESAHVAEVHIVDRATDKIVIRRVPVGPSESDHAAEVLAVRAVELLRASLLELLASRRPAPPVASPARPSAPALEHAARWAAQTIAPPPERDSVWALEAGAAVLADFTGIPPAALAVLRVRRRAWGPLDVRLTTAGLGSQSRVDASAGSALVGQDFGLLEAVVEIRRSLVLRPVASIGAGALYTAVDGRASYPFASEHHTAWAALGDLGAGAALRLGRHWDVALEVHVLVALPYPVVEVLGADVARAEQPSIFASLSVVGWL